MPDQIEKRLLTATEAAAYLGISLYTLKKIETMGCLRPYRTRGGHRRYRQQILDKYLEGNTCSPGRVHHRSEGVMAPTGAREKRRGVALVDRTQVERAEEAVRQSDAQVRKRLEEQTFLREAMAVISSTVDLPSVLMHLGEQMCTAIDSTSAYITSFDPETNRSSVLAEYYGPQACAEERVSDLGETYEEGDERFLAALKANQPHIDQVDDPDLPQAERAVMLEYGAQSALYIPLWIGAQLIGYAEVYESRRRREFTPEEIALCQAIAQSAAVAIENARLYEESERRLRQSELLATAIEAVASTLDLTELLTRIAEQMCLCVDATSAYIASYDQETDTSSTLAEFLGAEACAQEQAHDFGRIYEEIDAKFLAAMRANQHYLDHVDDPRLPQTDRAYMLQYGAQSILYVPLWIREHVLGYCEVWESRRRREFTPEEIALCQAIAQSAAIAIENARLYEEAHQEIVERRRAEEALKKARDELEARVKERASELRIANEQLTREIAERARTEDALRASEAEIRKRLGEQTTLREAMAVISSTLDLPNVLTRIAEQMCNSIHATSAYISSFEPESNTSTVLAEYFGPAACPEERVSDLGHTYDESDARLFAALRTNQHHIDHVDDPDLPEHDRAVMLRYRAQSILYTPLWIREQLVGYADVWESRERREFTPQEIALCRGIAQSAAVAIENARLYQEAQRRIAELAGVHEISQAFSSMTDVRETYGELTKRIAQLIGCDMCMIARYDDQVREMIAQPPGYGVPDELVRSYRYEVDAPHGRHFWNFRLQGPLLVNDMAEMPDFFSQWTEGFRHFNVLIVPMIVEGSHTGLVIAANKSGGFAEGDSKLLSIFANQAAVIIENARLFEETERLAATDPLTGVWNRRHTEERRQAEAARARRFGHELSVLVMDLDDLKLVNDAYGHPLGDEVIRRVAQLVLNSCRAIDIVGRYGGDEFSVILPETGPRGAETVAERILANLEKEPFEAPRGSKVPISISIGAASYPVDTDDPDRLFSLADAAMYRAKLAGGGQFASLTVGPERGPVASVAAFDVLQGLLITVNAKDHYTFKHSREVTQHALALARHMGLSEEEISALEIAGNLHDVGKIGIPTDVLRKPGRLTPEEFKVVQEHPRLGHTLLQQLPQMETVLQAVLHHHERYDGTGYPDALKGEEIPLLARILAVADAFSAMVTDRPYRKALTLEEARDEVRCEAGKRFDPELAERFVELVEKGEIQ